MAAYSRSKAYVSFQVRVTPELKEQLVRLSFESGVSQASIVASALKHYFATKRDPREDDEDNADEN